MLNLEQHWYQSRISWLMLLLLPLSWLFRLIVLIRFHLYRYKIKKQITFSVPVIVVGNITVGGTGNTPLVIWLADFLRKNGYQPAIVTRGVGGKKHFSPIQVQVETNPIEVGDEAVLLAERAQCPVVVCVDRVAAVK